MYIVYVIDTSALRHARVPSAMGDAVREHLAKDTIEGAALDAAKRIQERADALKAARPDCLGCADAVCDDCGPHKTAHRSRSGWPERKLYTSTLLQWVMQSQPAWAEDPKNMFRRGGTITGRVPSRPAHQDLPHRANDNKPGGRDLVGHSSVQAWSAGPIFPAVIARIEDHADWGTANPHSPLAARQLVLNTRWELNYPGRMPQRFGSYEAAHTRALHLNAHEQAAA